MRHASWSGSFSSWLCDVEKAAARTDKRRRAVFIVLGLSLQSDCSSKAMKSIEMQKSSE
jgi:hypothetical protein